MDAATLRARLEEILREEEGEEPRWEAVARLCRRLEQQLDGDEAPHVIVCYLADTDIRARDKAHGQAQRAEVRHFIEIGECEASKDDIPWGCLAIILVAGAPLAWLIL